MEQFNRQTLPIVQEAIKDALKEVGAEHGLSFELGKMTFLDTSFTLKVECVINNGSDNCDNVVAKHTWDEHCVLFALSPEDFGKTFESNGSTFEICGCKPNNRKYPIITKNLSNGKQFKFNIASIARKMLRG